MRFLFICAVIAAISYAFRSRIDPLLRKRTYAMSVDEAASLLDISPMSSADEIKAAHRRAIKHAHPDAGGSVEDAARINLARDTLLAYYRRYES